MYFMILALSTCFASEASFEYSAAVVLCRVDLQEIFSLFPDGSVSQYDALNLISSLEESGNPEGPRPLIRFLFVEAVKEKIKIIEYRLEKLRGAWLHNRQITEIQSLSLLLNHFNEIFSGFVLWDSVVRRTANIEQQQSVVLKTCFPFAPGVHCLILSLNPISKLIVGETPCIRHISDVYPRIDDIDYTPDKWLIFHDLTNPNSSFSLGYVSLLQRWRKSYPPSNKNILNGVRPSVIHIPFSACTGITKEISNYFYPNALMLSSV